jgi:hypothetical protein
VLGGSDLFERPETVRFRQRQTVDEDGVVARVLSISFNAAAPAWVRRDVEARVRAIARAARPPLRLPYVTELYLAWRAAS